MFRIFCPWGRVFLWISFTLWQFREDARVCVLWVCKCACVSVVRQIFTTGLFEYVENVNNSSIRSVFVPNPIGGMLKARCYRFFFGIQAFLKKNCKSITKFNGITWIQWATSSRLFLSKIWNIHVKYGSGYFFFGVQNKMNEQCLWGSTSKVLNCAWFFHTNRRFGIFSFRHWMFSVSILFHISQDVSGPANYIPKLSSKHQIPLWSLPSTHPYLNT